MRVAVRIAVAVVAVVLVLTAADAGQAVAPADGLRLTVGGLSRDWSRMVRLRCEPAPGGPHPHATAACAELKSSGGDFNALPGRSGQCHEEYRPVVATAQGEFAGHTVRWRKKFANPCILRVATGQVFAF
jgi:hypothetical protein